MLTFPFILWHQLKQISKDPKTQEWNRLLGIVNAWFSASAIGPPFHIHILRENNWAFQPIAIWLLETTIDFKIGED